MTPVFELCSRYIGRLAELDPVFATMRGVVERHLDRFAFREAPLTFDWR